MASHRPTLKKKQKGFKSKHASKGAIKTANKGRIEKPGGSANGSHMLTKLERKNLANQIKAHKQATAAERVKIFDGKHGIPRNVVVVPLTDDIDAVEAVNKVTAELEGVPDPTVPGVAWIPRFRQRLRFFVPQFKSFYDVLDSARAADFVVFVLSATKEIDDYGEQVMRCIGSQGVTTAVGTIYGLSNVAEAKRQSQIRESLTSWFSHFFADEKLYSLDHPAELLVALRIVSQRIPKGVHWRDERSYLVAESITPGPNGGVVVKGRVRGQALSADALVHVPGVGDLQIEGIEIAVNATPAAGGDMDVDAQEPLRPTGRPDGTLDTLIDPSEAVELNDAEEAVDGAGIRVDGHSYLTELVEADMEEAPSTLKKLPKGVSEYQAAWLLEGVDYGFEASDYESGDSDEEGELVQKEAEMDDVAEPEEEDDLDHDGLKKFREAQEDLEFPDEIELEPRESGKQRLSRYRGVRSLRHSEWDPYEADPRMPAEYTRLWRPGSLLATKNKLVKELSSGLQAPVGSDVSILVSGDAANIEKLASLTQKQSALAVTLYALLPGEQKQGVVSMSIGLDSEVTEPIKSKESLVVQMGPRRLLIRPLFNQGGHNDNDVYKFHRYLHPGRAATATVIAPVILGQVPVVYFNTSLEEPSIVGTGSVLNADTKRVIVKTAVLTGYPVKIHRKLVTVRYMFFNREDVQWFKAVPLFTKHGAQGVIKESLGTHGYFKATFDKKIRANDTIAMAVYKRVWPLESQVL